MRTSPLLSLIASSATRTASPVPRGGSCIATVAPSPTTDRAVALSFERTTTGRAPTSARLASTCASSGRPAAVCSTFGVRDRIRVPNPAASTMPSGDVLMFGRFGGGLGRQDSNLGSGIQSPLPYHLATPQRTRPKFMCFVLFGGPLAAVAVRAVLGLFAATDELRDATTTFAAELRVALAAELRLPRFAASAPELGVALRPELGLARLAALASELCVSLGAELSFAGLTAPFSDLPIEARAVLSRGRRAALLAGLPNCHVAALVIHAMNVRGQPSVARRNSLGGRHMRARLEARAAQDPRHPQRIAAIISHGEERRAAAGEEERDPARGRGGAPRHDRLAP